MTEKGRASSTLSLDDPMTACRLHVSAFLGEECRNQDFVSCCKLFVMTECLFIELQNV